MFNLLKSDMYRLAHGKMLWVALLVVALAAACAAGLLWFATTPEFAMMVQENAGEASDGTASLEAGDADLTLDEVEALNAREEDSLTYAVAQMFLSGGLFGVIVSVLAGLVCAGDFATGFAKNVLAGRRSRVAYYAEKLVLVALLSLAVVLAGTVFTYLGLVAAGFSFRHADTAGELALWVLLAWLTVTAYAFLTATVAWLSRSKGAAMLTAALVSSTVAASVLMQACMLLGGAVPVLGHLPNLFLENNVGLLGGGAADLLAPDASTMFGWPPAVQVAVVGALAAAVSATVALAAGKRKDV